MATAKRHRQICARKIVKKTGVPYGAAVRLVKVMEQFGSYHDQVTDLDIEPVYSDCKCCGIRHYLLKGPKGTLRFGGYYGEAEINLSR